MKVYLVGGAVRDMLLNRPVKDRDWVVVGATPQEMLDAGFTQVGADFPVFLHPETKEEYALARTERKTGRGYHGFVTIHDHTVTLEQDLERRDLTINAMAIAEEDLDAYMRTKDKSLIVDPFRGKIDLTHGVLRHVSDAFAEDPLRILRVARFAARYNFAITPPTYDCMRKMVEQGELAHLAPERVWVEFEKAIMEPYPHLYFRTLSDCGALEKVHSFFGVAQYPEVLDVCDDLTDEMAVRHRTAAVLILCMVHMAAHNDDRRRIVEYERNRVPNDVRKLVEQFMALTTRQTDPFEPGTANDWLHRLKHVNWYRDPVMLDEIRCLLPPYQFVETRFMQLEAAFHTTRDVAFADLTDEQKATLRGPAVGEAIDELRLERLRKLEFEEKLRG